MKLIQLNNIIHYKKQGATHTGIITRIEGETIWIAEAIGKPFQEYEYETWWLDARIKEGKVWVRRSIFPLKDVYKNAQKYFGRKYDWLAVYTIALKSLFGINSIIGNKFKGDKFLICSEGALRTGYDSSNKKLDLTKEFNKPEDLIPPICIDLSKQFEDVK